MNESDRVNVFVIGMMITILLILAILNSQINRDIQERVKILELKNEN